MEAKGNRGRLTRTRRRPAFLIATLGALALATGYAAASSANQPRGASAAGSGPVLVLDSGSAAFAKARGDFHRLRLNAISDDVTSVSGQSGSPEINVTTRELVDRWPDLGFDRNPPNAVVDSRGRADVAITLKRPKLRHSRLIFRAQRIESAGGKLADRGAVPRSSLPSRLGFTTLHIDAADGDQAVLDAIHGSGAGDPSPGSWIEFHTFIDAWAGDGDCNGRTWGVGNGDCFGKFTKGGTDPYNASRVSKGYFGWSNGTGTLTVEAGRNLGGEGYLEGRAPGRASPEFYVSDRSFFFSAKYGPVKTGSDSTKLGKEGGPLLMNVQYHSAGPFANDGYTIDLRGYLWCTGYNLCRPGG